MMDLRLATGVPGQRLGLKGPGAADWLMARGIQLPRHPNSWARPLAAQAVTPAEVSESLGAANSDDADDFVVARLGATEFFLEESAAGRTLPHLAQALRAHARGVYPVLREDYSLVLSGDAVHGVLTQVCNVDFASLDVGAQPVIMTLMIGVSVLVVPQMTAEGRRYRIWCDPTFGRYLGETLAALVMESGGTHTGVAA
jgi:sarcosine oxidase subunit gamma